MNRCLFILGSLALAFAACGATPPADQSVPVAPITPVAFDGWTNAFLLQNASMEVAVVPAIGRIASIRFRGGENLLRLDAGLKGREPDAAKPEPWMNFGGDWLWPVVQSRWPTLAKSDWPPPPVLAEGPWTGTAWKGADGSLCCWIVREYPDPLRIKVSRQLRLEPDAARISIRQRIESTGPSSAPVVLWTISQVGGADRIFLPTDSASLLERGFKAMMFGPPEAKDTASCGNVLVYEAGTGGEHKLCSDSKKAWLAAQKGNVLIVERATSEDTAGTYPDGGCTVELYSNSGLGYSEIETLSVERQLAPTEALQNTLTIECFPLATNLSPCEAARELKVLTGEEPTEPARE